MNLAELNALPESKTPPCERLRANLLETAKLYREIETRAYKSFSGADVADAPKWGLLADGFGCIANGKDVDAVIALLSRKWEAYAAENNAKVAKAPKLKRGPSSGHSVISYRHVCADFESEARFLRQMVTP